jgi:hypothetical protein
VTLAAPMQRSLPGVRVKVYLPTTDFIGARGQLHLGRTEEVQEMLDEGRITWAWNIATRQAKRAEVRFLVHALDAAAKGERFDASLDVVARLLAGHLVKRGQTPPFIRGKDFARIFATGSDHVSHLLEEGTLKRLPGTDWRRGPGGSAVIGWDQFLAFLDERRLAR